MWLLNTSTYRLCKYEETNAPRYAILSHTWTDEELSLQEHQSLTDNLRTKSGYQKLKKFCDISAGMGHKYAWIDTVCIDKTSSAELAEAINSMYRYYLNSSVCIVYMNDVRSSEFIDLRDTFLQSRWFTRGFTLQELIAGRNRRFFNEEWSEIEDRHIGGDLLQLCSQISGVDEGVLHNADAVKDACVAERMSWAALRDTTRPEDRAYSLMGIFGVSMPILYGEGQEKAFYRLQREIMKVSFDQTLFAWRGHYKSSGLLASSPADFAETPRLGLWGTVMLAPHYFTNIGIVIRLCLYTGETDLPKGVMKGALQCDMKTSTGWKILCIRLERVYDAHCYVNGEPLTAWRRIDCDTWDLLLSASLAGSRSLYEEAVVLEDEHLQLVKRSLMEDNGRYREQFWGAEEESLTLKPVSRNNNASGLCAG